MTEYAFEGAKRANTTVTWSFETQTLPADALYPFSAPISGIYLGLVQLAFAHWASVSGVTFTQVSDSAASAIRIGFGVFSSSDIVGQTLYRFSAGYLASDTVIRLLDPAYQPVGTNAAGTLVYSAFDVSVYQVIEHEIGHALGLDHSTDPYAIMYPVATALNRDLGVGDIEGVNALYPLYTVAAQNPVQVEGNASAVQYRFLVTRYSDPASALTVSYQVVGAAYAGLAGSVAAPASEFGGAYPSGRVTFDAGATTATVTVTLPGNSTPGPDFGFAITIASLDPTTSAATRGSNGAVTLDDDGFNPAGAGALVVYRFFGNTNGTHFFTASETERNAIILSRPDMTYEGIDMEAVAGLGSNPSAIPVYRFFDTRFGTHFYTASATERDVVAATRSDLVAEGVSFYEDANQRPGDAPVLRYFDKSNGTHFYSSSAAEQASIAATRPDLVNEGVAFYAPVPA